MKPSIPTLLLLCTRASISYAQICEPNTTDNAASSHYLLKTDGTAFDKKTNLTWMRCALGQSWANNACADVPQLI